MSQSIHCPSHRDAQLADVTVVIEDDDLFSKSTVLYFNPYERR